MQSRTHYRPVAGFSPLRHTKSQTDLEDRGSLQRTKIDRAFAWIPKPDMLTTVETQRH